MTNEITDRHLVHMHPRPDIDFHRYPTQTSEPLRSEGALNELPVQRVQLPEQPNLQSERCQPRGVNGGQEAGDPGRGVGV